MFCLLIINIDFNALKMIHVQMWLSGNLLRGTGPDPVKNPLHDSYFEQKQANIL